MGVVAEHDAGVLELAVSLDVDLVRSVDEDVGDRWVLHQRLDRPESEGLVLDLDDEVIALLAAQGGLVEREHVLDDPADLLLDDFARENIQLGEVEALDQLAVDTRLELVIRLLAPLLRMDWLSGDGRVLARHRPVLKGVAVS